MSKKRSFAEIHDYSDVQFGAELLTFMSKSDSNSNSSSGGASPVASPLAPAVAVEPLRMVIQDAQPVVEISVEPKSLYTGLLQLHTNLDRIVAKETARRHHFDTTVNRTASTIRRMLLQEMQQGRRLADDDVEDSRLGKRPHDELTPHVLTHEHAELSATHKARKMMRKQIVVPVAPNSVHDELE
jgi:hypothetical protein